jgi:hypothetical protein
MAQSESSGSTEQKITEIMTLIGVNPRDFERAAVNFRRMEPAEIDARLLRLQAGEKRLQAWRAGPTTERPSQVVVPNAAILRLTRDLEASNRVIGSHLNDLKHLIDRLRRWEQAIPRTISTAVSTITEQLVSLASRRNQPWADDIAEKVRRGVHGTVTETQLIASQARNRDTIAALEKIRQQLADVLHHPILWSDGGPVGHYTVVEALARMENSIAFYQPDVLVAMNAEGLGISQLLRDDMQLDLPIVTVHGDVTTPMQFENAQGLQAKTVCVVGHVAWSGATLERTTQLLGPMFKTDKIFGAVLVASGQATERLRTLGPFVYHGVIETTQFDLGVDPAQGIEIQRDGYIIGGTSTGTTVTRESLRQARSQVANTYSAPMEGWR